jgi:hypothetical protein
MVATCGDAGYMSTEPRAEFYRHIDAANVDLKGFTGEPLMTARELLAELLAGNAA